MTMPLPYVGDSNYDVTRIMRMFDPLFSWREQEILSDFPVGDDWTYIRHYLRGAAGPWVDFVVYIDVGIGFSIDPVGFDDEDTKQEAKKAVDDAFEKMNFQQTMSQFATYREVLGRACMIKTYDMNGNFYYNESQKVTGVDVINPMTLAMESVQDVMDDTTGTVPFIQRQVGRRSIQQPDLVFPQERVIYETRNPLTKWSAWGVSSLQNCLTDLRTIAKFPRYRADMARKFSNIHRHWIVDSAMLQETQFGAEILNDAQKSEDYLNELHKLIADQEEKSANIATFNFVDSKEVTYGGKEPDISGLENQSLSSMGVKFGVPVEVMTGGVNRATLEMMSDLLIKKREMGPRRQVYTPIINGIANEILQQQGFDGFATASYNEFLTKDINALVQRDVMLYNIGAISDLEIRRDIDFPDIMEQGSVDTIHQNWLIKMAELAKGGDGGMPEGSPTTAPSTATKQVGGPPTGARAITPNQQQPGKTDEAFKTSQKAFSLDMKKNKIIPIWFDDEEE